MTATTFTGALNGIASNAINADNAVTAGWATTAGLAITANRAITAAYALNATTAKNAVTAGYAATANYAFNAGTATYATTAGHATDSTKLPLSGGTMTGALTLAGEPSVDNDAATKKYVDTQISNVSGPMKFKGTLGATSTGATVNSLPNPSTANLGYTYKVLTEGTYQGVSARVGDLMVSTGTLWVNIPSGDEPDGTVKTISTGDGLTGGPISVTGTVSHAIPSGATASTLGSSSDRTYIKSITTDKFGHITGVGTGSETVTNSDSKQNVVLNQTTKAYITAVTATPTSTPQALTAIADTDVYLDTTSGQLAAKSFKITGTSNSSNTLTSDATNNVYFQVNSKTPLVIMDTTVRPGLSYDNTVTLGATNARWKNVYATTFTGNLNGKAENANYAGTATYSSNAGTATYAKNATTAKYATTSSYADTAVTANYATTAGNATYAESAGSVKNKIFYGTCSSGTADTAKTVTCAEFASADLVKGAVIFVTFDNTNSGAVGSITLNVNQTGAKNIKELHNATIYNLPGVNYIVGGNTYMFQYNGTYWVMSMDYDTNDVNRSVISYPRLKTGAVGIGRAMLFMEASDGTFQGLSSTFNSVGTSHVKNTNTFKLGRVYYANRSTDIAANTTVTDNSWMDQQTSLIDLRYSTNCSTTLTANKPVYIVGSVNSAGQFTLDDVWYTQTLPTEENGKVYIYLGIVYPDTNPYRVAFEIENPAYCYKNGGIQLFQNWAKYSDNAAAASTASYAGTAAYAISAAQATKISSTPNNTTTFLRGDNSWSNTLTGSFSANTITITNTAANAHLSFSRTGGDQAPNYINVPADSSLGFSVGGVGGQNIKMCINGTAVHSWTTNTISLGTTAVKWKYVYATTFNGWLNGTATTATQAVHAATANSATTASQATHAATANSATTATNAQKVIQTNQTGANDYRVLLSGSANDTTEYSGTNKNTNLRFNPSTQLLSIGGSVSATGDLTITGNANLNGESYIESAVINSLLVNGAASFVQSPTAPTPADNSNDTTVATTAFVKNAFTANDAMVFKGTIGSSGATVTSLPATHKQGWTYKVITAGTYAGQACEIGDTIYCITDGTSANNDHWTVVQTNIDGAVIGPASSTSGNLALFNGTTGKLIADSGKSVTTSTATSSSTDSTIPTSKALWGTLAATTGAWRLGTVTTVTAGTGLTTTSGSSTDGGSITSTGTLYLTKTGVAAGSYGPSAAVTGSHGTTMNVPYITVDAYGRVTSISNKVYTAQNSTYTVGNKALQIASNTGTTTTAITMNESSADKTLTVKGDGTYITGAVSGSAGAVTVTLSHADPTAVEASKLTANASGASAAWSIDVVKGITINRDAKGHVTGLSVTSGKIPANPNTDASVKQSVSTTDSWRKLLLHYTADGTSTASVTTATNQVYAASGISVQPSTNTIRANVYNVMDKVSLVFNTTTNALDFVFA